MNNLHLGKPQTKQGRGAALCVILTVCRGAHRVDFNIKWWDVHHNKMCRDRKIVATRPWTPQSVSATRAHLQWIARGSWAARAPSSRKSTKNYALRRAYARNIIYMWNRGNSWHKRAFSINRTFHILSICSTIYKYLKTRIHSPPQIGPRIICISIDRVRLHFRTQSEHNTIPLAKSFKLVCLFLSTTHIHKCMSLRRHSINQAELLYRNRDRQWTSRLFGSLPITISNLCFVGYRLLLRTHVGRLARHKSRT